MPNKTTTYRPAVKKGLLFLVPLCLLLGAAVVTLLWLAFQEQYGSYFIIFLLAALVLLVPLAFFSYRIYALLRAGYQLERDGFLFHWGLRSEAIPLPDVKSITPISQIKHDLPLPKFIFPGAILGKISTKEMGNVEFIASEIDHMLLVTTKTKTFVISPRRNDEFVREFQSILELGSLTPIKASSILPAGFLRTVISDRTARILIFGGLFFTLALLATVSLLIPGRTLISLGFTPSGLPLEPVPATRLLLLPFLCVFSFLIDFAMGLFFFQKEKSRAIAYFLWGASILTPILLLISLFFLI